MKVKFFDFTFLKRLVEKLHHSIDKEHQHIKETIVLPEAKNYAAKDMPGQEEESIEPFLDTIKGAYTALKKKVSVWLQGGIQKKLGAVNLATAKETIDAKQGNIDRVRRQIENKEVDRNRIHVGCDFTSYQTQRWKLFLLAIGECGWFIGSFLFMGDSMIISILLGVVLGIAQIVAVKTCVQIIKEITDAVKRRLYIILAVIGFTILSLLLSWLRYWFVQVSGGGNIPFMALNPFTFTAINFLLIGATGMIIYFYYPSKDELMKIRQIEKLNSEITVLEKAAKHLELEKEQLIKQREFLIELRVHQDHAEQKLLEKIDGMYQEAVGMFKNENVAKRSDGIFPPSFRNPNDPLPSYDGGDLLLT